jgi:hypothetical protein
MAEMLSAALQFPSGPLRGALTALEEGEHSIGRDPANRVNPGYLHRLMNKLGLREQLGRVP